MAIIWGLDFFNKKLKKRDSSTDPLQLERVEYFSQNQSSDNLTKLGIIKNLIFWNLDKNSVFLKKILWREGVWGHFCMFGSYERTCYCWTAAFYGTKKARRVKKLLTFEGQPSDNFPVEIYRGNLVFLVHTFLYLDLRC